jgi:hypothetical protein
MMAAARTAPYAAVTMNGGTGNDAAGIADQLRDPE